MCIRKIILTILLFFFASISIAVEQEFDTLPKLFDSLPRHYMEGGACSSCVKLAPDVFIAIRHGVALNTANDVRSKQKKDGFIGEEFVLKQQAAVNENQDIPKICKLFRFDTKIFVIEYENNLYKLKPLVEFQEIETIPVEKDPLLKGDNAILIFTKKVDSLAIPDCLLRKNNDCWIRLNSGWKAQFIDHGIDRLDFKETKWDFAENFVHFDSHDEVVFYNNLNTAAGSSGGILLDGNDTIVGIISKGFKKVTIIGNFLECDDWYNAFYKAASIYSFKTKTTPNGQKTVFYNVTAARIIFREQVEKAFMQYKERVFGNEVN